MKKRLLSLKEPKAAPVLVTKTSAKNSGTMMRGSSGAM